MQDDERIKMLLHEYGVEETSSTFNNNVMQRINIAFTKQTKPLLNAFILKLLKIVFSIVLIAIIICFVFIPINNFHTPLSINLSGEVYRQMFTFIIVFWVVMLMNMWLNKRWISKNVFV